MVRHEIFFSFAFLQESKAEAETRKIEVFKLSTKPERKF